MLWSYRKCPKIQVWKTLLQIFAYDQTFACSDNPGQNIWNKMEKSNKTGMAKKNLITLLRVFELLLSKFNFWKGECIFLIFPNFLLQSPLQKFFHGQEK